MKKKFSASTRIKYEKIFAAFLIVIQLCTFLQDTGEASGIGFFDIFANSSVFKENIKAEVEKEQTELEKLIKPIRNWSFNATRSIYWGDKSKDELAITFDDGLNKVAVEKVLKILKENDVKCTFFVLGKAIRQQPDLWKQAAEDGHEICNHTQTHALLANLSDAQVKKEIRDWEGSVKDVLGDEYFKKMKKEFPFLRLPGGSGEKSKRIMKIISDEKYVPVGWSVETVHSVLQQYNLKKTSAEAVARSIENHVVGSAQRGAIVLLHFNAYDIVRLEEIIKTIKSRGKTLKLVSEIIKN